MEKIVISLLSIAFLVLSCTPVEKQCTVDAECVPAQCCHATDAVNKEFAPDCQNALCTLQCEPGTLDCGQGEVKCINNKCTAVIE